jgi:hypothetical protein
MTEDPTAAVEALFVQAQAAHHEFEATELNGVYDEEWPRWYAEYAVENGLVELVGHAIATDRLGQFLADSYAEFEAAEPKPSEPWPAYIARRIAAEL